MGLGMPVWGEYAEASRAISRPARRYVAASGLLWVGRGIQAVLFNLYLVAAGFSEAFVGRTLGAMGLGVAAAALPAGSLSERWGRRTTLVLGFALEGAGGIVRILWTHPVPVIAASAVLGAGMALIAVAGLPFLTKHSTARERPYVFSILQAVSLVAQVAGSLVGGMLPVLLAAQTRFLGDGGAFQTVLVASGVVVIAAAWPLARVGGAAEGPPADDPFSPPVGIGRVVRNAMIVFFLTGTAIGLVLPFMNLYFAQRFAASTGQIGVYFSVAAVLTAGMSLAGAGLGTRFGALRVVCVAQLAALPFLVLLGFETSVAAAVVAFLAGITLMRVGLPLLQSAVMSAVPSSMASRVSSRVFLVWSLGWAASTAVAGWMVERFGFAAPLSLAASVFGLSSLVLFFIFRGRPRQPASHPLTPDGPEPR